MGDAIRDFRDLLVWQKAIQLATQVCVTTKRLPADERFGLTAQVRRAATSVSSNIAEGHSRQGKEFAHFLSVAKGSLAEVESQLLLAVELQFLSAKDIDDSLALANELHRMITALLNRVRPR